MDYTYYFYYRPFPLDCQCNSVKQSKINSTVASKDCNNPQTDQVYMYCFSLCKMNHMVQNVF